MASSFTRTVLLVATALSVVGCQNGAATRAMNPTASATKGAGMEALQAQVQAASTQQVREAGVAMAEARVGVQPEDIEARRMLAQVYLASGRFRSAAQAFDDALAMAPGDDGLRLKKALALLAQGNSVAAIGELDRIRHAADAGLAYALAGQPARGIELLTEAARAPDATPRVRQNLALAYALSGQWARAKVIAGQDLDPAAVDLRLRDWAMLASTADSALQTAGLLGVMPDASDGGRPVGLAYIPPASRVGQPQLAAVTTASASSPIATTEVGRPAPALSALAASPAAAPRVVPAAQLRKVSATPVSRNGGRWAVQLGAYDRPELVESNWRRLLRRSSALLDGFEPSRSEAVIGARRYHRLSIAGFDARSEAIELCEALQAQGRDCFVRRVGVAMPKATRA